MVAIVHWTFSSSSCLSAAYYNGIFPFVLMGDGSEDSIQSDPEDVDNQTPAQAVI